MHAHISQLLNTNDLYQELKKRELEYINVIKDLHEENHRLRMIIKSQTEGKMVPMPNNNIRVMPQSPRSPSSATSVRFSLSSPHQQQPPNPPQSMIQFNLGSQNLSSVVSLNHKQKENVNEKEKQKQELPEEKRKQEKQEREKEKEMKKMTEQELKRRKTWQIQVKQEEMNNEREIRWCGEREKMTFASHWELGSPQKCSPREDNESVEKHHRNTQGGEAVRLKSKDERVRVGKDRRKKGSRISNRIYL